MTMDDEWRQIVQGVTNVSASRAAADATSADVGGGPRVYICTDGK
ncbi:MAG: hypothetical protein ABIV47_12595 [Roseiflexaceae bacterium]